MLRRALASGSVPRSTGRALRLAVSAAVVAALALAPAGAAARRDALPSLSISDVSVTEGNSGSTRAEFTVTLSAASAQTVTVRFSTRDGSARASGSPRDYNAFSSQVTFAPGETSKTANIYVQGDTEVESDEWFDVLLTMPVNATIADPSGHLTIVNDDTARTLSINDVQVTEGDTGSTRAEFTISLSGPSTATVTARYSTRDGSARASGSPRDYNAFTGQVTFAPGETSKTVNVYVQGDTEVEPEESFYVVLSQPTNATVDTVAGRGQIVDDDVARTIAIGDVRVQEGDTGSAPAAFTVTLSVASTATVKVRYSSRDGSARASGSPRDYNSFSGQVTFAPGETAKTANIYVQGDTDVESDESFFVVLSQPTNATIGDGTGTGVIVNDDVRHTVSVAGTSVTEGNSGRTPLAFTVTLSPPASAPTTVRFSAQPGTADHADFGGLTSGTVTFAVGESTKTISLDVVGDTKVEPNETLTMALELPIGATVGGGPATGTILNDDSATSFSVAVIAALDTKAGVLTLRLVTGARAELLIVLVRGTATVGSWRRGVAAGKSTLSLSAPAAKVGDLLRIAAKGRDGATGSAEVAVPTVG